VNYHYGLWLYIAVCILLYVYIAVCILLYVYCCMYINMSLYTFIVIIYVYTLIYKYVYMHIYNLYVYNIYIYTHIYIYCFFIAIYYIHILLYIYMHIILLYIHIIHCCTMNSARHFFLGCGNKEANWLWPGETTRLSPRRWWGSSAMPLGRKTDGIGTLLQIPSIFHQYSILMRLNDVKWLQWLNEG
jgi:hypothetical protein